MVWGWCACLQDFWGYIDGVIDGWSLKVMGEGSISYISIPITLTLKMEAACFPEMLGTWPTSA